MEEMEHMPDRNRKSKGQVSKTIRYLRSRGLQESAAHAVEKVRDSRFEYQKWILRQEISSVTAGYQMKLRLRRMPRVHVLIFRTAQTAARVTLDSVREQTYRNLSVTDTLTTHIDDHAYILIVPDGAVLPRHAVFEMVSALQEGGDALYADSDSFRKEGDGIRFFDPKFKPDHNPDYLRSVNYISSPFLVRAGLVRALYADEGFGVPDAWKLSDPAAYYDLVLRCAEAADAGQGILHVPRVLCHVPEGAQQMPDSAGLRGVLADDLRRRGMEGEVEDGPVPGSFHIRYALQGEPLVSIVIPNKDNVSVLENCIWSIRHRTAWKRYEIVIVENNSTQQETFDCYRKLEETGQARVVRYGYPFHFSRVVNEGVRQSEGEYVILMNNDVTVRTPDWIERLLSQCQRPEVGAAGPKLLYPDGRVQSAGIVVGLMGFAGSMMVAEDGDDPGYMGRACLTQDLSALTAACLMVKRSVYMRAGGFAQDLPVALNDVDFCLKLNAEGLRCVFEPSAVMIHHESLTRGLEDTKEKRERFRKEKKVFRERWKAFLEKGDPAYNPNLSRRRCDWSQQT